MKLASIHGVSLDAIFRETARQFSPTHRRHQDQTRPSHDDAPRVTDIADDSYSEAINFRFEAGGVAHRGLVTYDAVREAAAADAFASTEPALALFIRHAREMGAQAAHKFERDGVEPVVLAEGDF